MGIIVNMLGFFCLYVCLFEDVADIVVFVFDNLQREFPKFFTFRARDKVGVLIQTYVSN